MGGVDVFEGVPYGDTVSVAARFRPAQAAPRWAGVRDALSLGTPSLQDPGTVHGRNDDRRGAERRLWREIDPPA